MSVFKRYKGKKVARADKNYDKATWIAQGMVGGDRYHVSLKTAKTREDAKTDEDLIIGKMRVGEFGFIKDNTKFAGFVDEIYLPYCEMNNVNYGQKVCECNSLKKFFGNIPLKSITSGKSLFIRHKLVGAR